MRASHLFIIVLLGVILYVLLSGRGQTDENDADAGALQAVKANVPRGAGMEWTKDGNLTFTLRFAPESPASQPASKPEAERREREQAENNPYDGVPD